MTALAVPPPGGLAVVPSEPLAATVRALRPEPTQDQAKGVLARLTALAGGLTHATMAALSPALAADHRRRMVDRGRQAHAELTDAAEAIAARPPVVFDRYWHGTTVARTLPHLAHTLTVAAAALDRAEAELAGDPTPVHIPACSEVATMKHKTATAGAETFGQPSTGPNLIKVNFHGREIDVEVEGTERRIRDLDLGAMIKLSRPRDIRKVIRRMVDDGKLPKNCERAAEARSQTPTGGEVKRTTVEYWLTRAQALKVIAKCETEVADAILNEVIAVYEAVLDQRMPPAQNDVIHALAKKVDGMETEINLLRNRLAVIEPTNGLIGRRNAGVHITGPMNALAGQVADMKGQRFRRVLTEMDREVRAAADHPKSTKGNKWERLPVGDFGRACRAIGGLQDRYKAELDAHAQRVAASRQLPLKPAG